MEIPRASELNVASLGECAVVSPLTRRRKRFVAGNRVLAFSDTEELAPFLDDGPPPSFEAAGPRSEIFFEPEKLTCGIVTCGGLCPGVNDVIRTLVLTLFYGYGVKRVLGFRYGFSGLTSRRSDDPEILEPSSVDNAHKQGGTLLGTSRGPQDVDEMVDHLMKWKVGVLFAVGGDGTLSGASALAEEIARRELDVAVIGIPKTIDNDLVWTERSFGFATAVEAAQQAIASAHSEAEAAWNGIGLVKLMGRHSGFIAAQATLASGDANFCLVPEVPFTLEGFLSCLEERLAERHHAVIVVAEGAGQDLMQSQGEERRDPSGNVKLKPIGQFLRGRIESHFGDRKTPVDVKLIDPSYMIRSQPANSYDSSFCLMLGQHAVHAGMAGRTDMMVGFWNHRFTHVPLQLVAGRRKQLEPDGEIWQRVLETTGQPASMVGR